MDLNVIRNMDAIDENSVISREGSSNGTKMTSSIINYEEVKRRQVVKNQARMRECGLCRGTIISLPCHCSSTHTCKETVTLCLKVHERNALCLGQIEISW
jgi:hypothetical protein